MDDVYKISWEILTKYDQSKTSIRELVRRTIYEKNINDVTKVSAIYSIVLETIRRLNTIDYLLVRSMPHDITYTKLPSELKAALRMALTNYRSFNKYAVPLFTEVSNYFKDRYSEILIRKLRRSLGKAINLKLADYVEKFDFAQKYGLIYSHPSYLLRLLSQFMSEDEILKLITKNNENKTIWLSVNTLKTDVDTVIDILSEENIEVEKDNDYPDIVLKVVKSELPIVYSKAHKKNLIFIQDKASIAAIKALAPQPGETIIDGCSAPGMKTRLIWELMGGEGKLIAVELSQPRIEKMKYNFEKIGYADIQVIHGDISKVYLTEADRILLDAPCTSSGTFQQNPDVKWKLNRARLGVLTTIQNKILLNSIKMSMIPPNRIIYSTCSLLPQEGEAQIDYLLKEDLIEIQKVSSIGVEGYSGYTSAPYVKRLFPHIHDTIGFFIAQYIPKI